MNPTMKEFQRITKLTAMDAWYAQKYGIRIVSDDGTRSGLEEAIGTKKSVRPTGVSCRRCSATMASRPRTRYTDDDVDKMSKDEAKAALKKCMADEDVDGGEDEEDEEAEDEDEDEQDDDDDDAEASRRVTEAGRKVRLAACNEVKRIKALHEIDMEFSSLLHCRILANSGKMSGLEEAIVKGRSPARYRRDCMKMARGMGRIA